jgi:hypothetical protein
MIILHSKRWLVYGISQEAWTRRFGVEPFSHPCSECGEVLTTSLPFVQGQMRGLSAPRCKCGNDHTPYAVVRDARYGDLFDVDVAPSKPRKPRKPKPKSNVIRVRFPKKRPPAPPPVVAKKKRPRPRSNVIPIWRSARHSR